MTETKCSYDKPYYPKRPLTRAAHNEHILWQQMTNEYYTQKSEQEFRSQQLNSTSDTKLTKYQLDFCQNKNNTNLFNDKIGFVLSEDTIQYPLYENGPTNGGMAISFWNSTEAINWKPFKQYHPLTKLNSECLEFQRR